MNFDSKLKELLDKASSSERSICYSLVSSMIPQSQFSLKENWNFQLDLRIFTGRLSMLQF